MILRVFDPTNERKPAGGQPAPRPASLKGKTIGFISNGKEGTAGYFAHLDRMLREEFGVADAAFEELNNSAPADAHIVDEIKNWKPSSPASAIEAAAHRGVRTTRSRAEGKASPLWG